MKVCSVLLLCVFFMSSMGIANAEHRGMNPSKYTMIEVVSAQDDIVKNYTALKEFSLFWDRTSIQEYGLVFVKNAKSKKMFMLVRDFSFSGYASYEIKRDANKGWYITYQGRKLFFVTNLKVPVLFDPSSSNFHLWFIQSNGKRQLTGYKYSAEVWKKLKYKLSYVKGAIHLECAKYHDLFTMSIDPYESSIIGLSNDPEIRKNALALAPGGVSLGEIQQHQRLSLWKQLLQDTYFKNFTIESVSVTKKAGLDILLDEEVMRVVLQLKDKKSNKSSEIVFTSNDALKTIQIPVVYPKGEKKEVVVFRKLFSNVLGKPQYTFMVKKGKVIAKSIVEKENKKHKERLEQVQKVPLLSKESLNREKGSVPKDLSSESLLKDAAVIVNSYPPPPSVPQRIIIKFLFLPAFVFDLFLQFADISISAALWGHSKARGTIVDYLAAAAIDFFLYPIMVIDQDPYKLYRESFAIKG